MNEYIEKNKIINLLEHNDKVNHYADKEKENIVYGTVQTLCNVIMEAEGADVPLVDRWISVNDKLPETNAIGVAHILAYDKYEGVVKADFLDESANYINGSNIFQISNTSTQLHKVTHWQPLPKPPKED